MLIFSRRHSSAPFLHADAAYFGRLLLPTFAGLPSFPGGKQTAFHAALRRPLDTISRARRAICRYMQHDAGQYAAASPAMTMPEARMMANSFLSTVKFRSSICQRSALPSIVATAALPAASLDIIDAARRLEGHVMLISAAMPPCFADMLAASTAASSTHAPGDTA